MFRLGVAAFHLQSLSGFDPLLGGVEVCSFLKI
jgi:hypothetical protein